jgi:hypothetical protein
MTKLPRGLPRTIGKRWDAFWFRPTPPEIYGVLRISFGVVGLISLIGLVPIETFWDPDGLVPLAQGGVKGALIDLGVGAIAGRALFVGLLVSFTCMAVGYRSTWAVAACFVGTILQSFWNSLPLAGGNEVLGILLFCLLWADCSAPPSLDSWLRTRGGRKTASSSGDSDQPMWPVRLIRFQIAFIYVNSAFWKLLGPTWRDGSTIHYVMNLNTFQRFPVSPPVGAEWILTLATYITLFWEMSFPIMLFHRWTRRVALLMGVFLHLGLWVALELGPFSWVMLASYIAFLDPGFVSRMTGRWLQRQQGTVGSSIEA